MGAAAPLLESPRSKGGRPRDYELREIVNALFYYLKNGCTWRDLPHDFPRWDNVYDHFRRWKQSGKIEHVHDLLREQVRLNEGRQPSPSAAVLDAQSIRTAEKRGTAGAMMPVSASPDGSGTSASTRSA